MDGSGGPRDGSRQVFNFTYNFLEFRNVHWHLVFTTCAVYMVAHVLQGRWQESVAGCAVARLIGSAD